MTWFKKVIIFLLLMSSSAFAQKITLNDAVSKVQTQEAQAILQSRLNKMTQFYAQFHQKIYEDGFLIQEGKGQFWLKRPNLFYWEMQDPDASFIVSNGKTVWYYTPAIKQVTLMNFDQSVNGDLLQLLTDNQSVSWSQYQVSQTEQTFTLTPRDPAQMAFQLEIEPSGKLTKIVMIEEDQTTEYALFNQSTRAIAPSKFEFEIPPKVTIDDQR